MVKRWKIATHSKRRPHCRRVCRYRFAYHDNLPVSWQVNLVQCCGSCLPSWCYFCSSLTAMFRIEQWWNQKFLALLLPNKLDTAIHIKITTIDDSWNYTLRGHANISSSPKRKKRSSATHWVHDRWARAHMSGTQTGAAEGSKGIESPLRGARITARSTRTVEEEVAADELADAEAGRLGGAPPRGLLPHPLHRRARGPGGGGAPPASTAAAAASPSSESRASESSPRNGEARAVEDEGSSGPWRWRTTRRSSEAAQTAATRRPRRRSGRSERPRRHRGIEGGDARNVCDCHCVDCRALPLPVRGEGRGGNDMFTPAPSVRLNFKWFFGISNEFLSLVLFSNSKLQLSCFFSALFKRLKWYLCCKKVLRRSC